MMKLKPCPFCGGKATTEFHELNGREYLSVGCANYRCRGCHGTTAAPEEQWADEVLSWNTRVADCIQTFDCNAGDHSDCCPGGAPK
jgi:hypothetical protein